MVAGEVEKTESLSHTRNRQRAPGLTAKGLFCVWRQNRRTKDQS